MAKRSTASAKNKKTMMDNGSLSGFTIIEVVLVLAIAGLIFLMVFIAFPQLARSQRDTQRQQDLASLNSAIIRFQGNNNGRLPSGSCVVPDDNDPKLGAIPVDTEGNSACRLIKTYMHGTLATADETNAQTNIFVDPQGATYDLTISQLGSGATATVDNRDNTIHMYTSATCNGEEAVHSNNPRDFVLMYRLEGSGSYCHGNNG